MDQLCDSASILHQNVADGRIWGCEMWLMYAYGANWKLVPAGPMLDGSHQLEAATRI